MFASTGIGLFLLLIVRSESRQQVTCPCGITKKNFTTYLEEGVDSRNHICGMFQYCSSCEDFTSHCVTCPAGYSKPFCVTAIASYDDYEVIYDRYPNVTVSRRRRSTQCETPAAPKFGMATCRNNPFEKICRGTCYPGYYFPNQDSVEISLSCVGNNWTPLSSFPPCVSDGSCQMELHRPGDFVCKTTSRGRFCDINCKGTRTTRGRYLCVQGEHWDPDLPYCARRKGTRERNKPSQTNIKQTVKSINCPNLLTPEMGRKSCVFSQKEKKCNGQCLNGYHFKDENTNEIVLHCGFCRWEPTSSFPQCSSEGTCDLEMRTAGTYNCTTDSSQTVCDISCFTNSNTQGNFICNSKQGWLSTLPHCVGRKSAAPLTGECYDPGEVENAWKRVPSSGFKVGSEITYTCLNNYEMVGDAKVTCQSDSSWSSEKPRCVEKNPLAITKVTCKLVSIPLHARVELHTRTDAGEEYWSLVMAPITSFRDATYRNIQTREFNIGDQIRFRCRAKFYEPEYAQYQTCQDSGYFYGPLPICKPVCGKSNVPRKPSIVNGKPTQIGQWPWHIALYILDRTTKSPVYSCGASLIAEHWVATAAHCVTYEGTNRIIRRQSITLYAGKYFTNITGEEYVQTLTVKRIISHKEYDHSNFESDIALLELVIPANLSTRIQPICLPTSRSSEENIVDGNIGIIIGWGITEFDKISEVLREGNVTIVSQRRCEERYRSGRLSINMFCARMDDDTSSDSCQGDSGGPLMFQEAFTNRWLLEGIISFGSKEGCGLKQHYAGYVKVIKFVEWIRQITQVALK